MVRSSGMAVCGVCRLLALPRGEAGLRLPRASGLQRWAVARRRRGPLGRLTSMPVDEEESEEFCAASFWRQPIGPPPPVTEQQSVPQPVAPQPETQQPSSTPPPQLPSHKEQQPPTEEQVAKLSAKINPPRLPAALSEMTMEQIKETLLSFQAEWYKMYRRPVRPSDTPQLPQQICELYDELGKRLSPEQVAKDIEQSKARKAAAVEQAAQRAAEADAAAKRQAEAAEARAKEWEEFEKNKDAAWKSAAAEAADQRDEAADAKGVSALSLTGASTFVKVDEIERDTRPTREQFIQSCKDDFGLV